MFLIFFIFCAYGYSFKEKELSGFSKDFLNKINKIKIRINYADTPNKWDFFTSTDNEKYLDLRLDGMWSGEYDLAKSNVYWTNPYLNKEEIFHLINFGHYNIRFKFNTVNEAQKILLLNISQESIDYDSVNVEVVHNKQINYWAKARSNNWLEVVRGKIIRSSNDELFAVFQTTVYDKKIPIYAFSGEAVLKRLVE